MKIFNILQQLWSYSLFCPVCKDICREISVVPDPYEVWKVEDISKVDNILKVVGTLHIKEVLYRFITSFDCVQNTFEYFLPEAYHLNTPLNTVESPSLTFHLEADCRKCLGSWVISNEVSMNFKRKQISSFSLDKEEVWYDQKFIINYDYNEKSMTIDKIIMKSKFSGDLLESPFGKPVKMPPIVFDWENKKKTLNKIKTMLTFS